MQDYKHIGAVRAEQRQGPRLRYLPVLFVLWAMATVGVGAVAGLMVSFLTAGYEVGVNFVPMLGEIVRFLWR